MVNPPKRHTIHHKVKILTIKHISPENNKKIPQIRQIYVECEKKSNTISKIIHHSGENKYFF